MNARNLRLSVLALATVLLAAAADSGVLPRALASTAKLRSASGVAAATNDATPQAVTVAPNTDALATATPVAGFDAGLAPFEVQADGEVIPYGQQALFVLPNQDVTLAIASTGTFTVEAAAGTTSGGFGSWTWHAPAAPGSTPVVLRRAEDGATVTLHAFVMVPYGSMKNGKVNGYYVGAYPAPRAKRTEAYARPRGFVEVTAETAKLPVSPHFTLGQFVCKAGEGFPKYVVVQPRLLRRLENLLQTANAEGITANSFTLMSAYRTPTYNKGIGNVTTFTRHQYGDAADIFVDEDGDGRMDDINRDGRHDKNDAMVLHQIAERTERTVDRGTLIGGLSAYSPTHEHGAFVHVDTRGFAARW